MLSDYWRRSSRIGVLGDTGIHCSYASGSFGSEIGLQTFAVCLNGCSLARVDRLQVNSDGDLFPYENAACFQRRVVGKTEVGAVNGCRGY